MINILLSSSSSVVEYFGSVFVLWEEVEVGDITCRGHRLHLNTGLGCRKYRQRFPSTQPQALTGSTTERFQESSGGCVSQEKTAGKEHVLFQRSWKETANPPKPQEVTLLLLWASF